MFIICLPDRILEEKKDRTKYMKWSIYLHSKVVLGTFKHPRGVVQIVVLPNFYFMLVFHIYLLIYYYYYYYLIILTLKNLSKYSTEFLI